MRHRLKKTRQTAEFGDFQTPPSIAQKACTSLSRLGISPNSIVEPTCGKGTFLLAALEHFKDVRMGFGLDINNEYVRATAERLQTRGYATKTNVRCDDFFKTDWVEVLRSFPEPILVVGNPPWVTSAELANLGGKNHPKKSNLRGYAGFDALTGKSNFDISEWMLTRLLELLQGKEAVLAMLCKTGVARKVLAHAWSRNLVHHADMRLVDAKQHFGASVDACFLTCRIDGVPSSLDCSVYMDLDADFPCRTIGFRDGQLVADVAAYDRCKHLQAKDRSNYRWRSGVKHDCSAIMELSKLDNGYVNSLGQILDLEDTLIFPMLKSSDLANGSVENPSRYMLVTQAAMGEDTALIAEKAPKTWAYLQRNAHFLDRRASSIYKNRPRFAIFGVGPYTFAPWKVAISGFYKSLEFKVVGPVAGKPIVLDDTSNFIPTRNRAEADYLASLLNSSTARDFFNSFVFWDNKRPITIDLLARLDIVALAREQNPQPIGTEHVGSWPQTSELPGQLELFTAI